MLSHLTIAAVSLLPLVSAHPPPPPPPGYGPGGSGGNGVYSTQWEQLQGSNYLPSFNWANANWPPQNVGVALVPQAPDQELISLLEGIDVNRTYLTFHLRSDG